MLIFVVYISVQLGGDFDL